MIAIAIAIPYDVPRCPDPEALDAAAATVRRALDCDCAVFAWYTGEHDIVVGAAGLSPDELDAARCSRFDAEDAFAAHVVVPLVVEARTVGELQLMNRSEARQLDIPLAQAIAAHYAASLHSDCLCPLTLAEPLGRPTALDQLALSADSPSDLIPRIEDALTPIFGTVRIGLMIWDDERAVLQMVSGSFDAPDSVTAAWRVDPSDLDGDAPLVFGLQRICVSNHLPGAGGIVEQYVDAFALERLISAPLIVSGRRAGILHVARTGKPFSAADLEQCNTVLPRIATAVQSTRMLTQLSIQRRVEAVLSEQAVAIASGTESKEVLRQKLEDFRVLFDASIVALIATDCDPLVAKSATVSASVEEQLLDDGRSEDDERVVVQPPAGAGDAGSVSLYVPVRLGTQLVGMLAVRRDRDLSFSALERHGLSRMADLIALSWAWARYQQHRAALARLEERQRVAEDLHDDVAQLLFAAQMQLDDILEDASTPEQVRARANLARALLIRGDTAIREVITKLSRPPATGLSDRLHEVIEGVDEQFMVPVRLEISTQAVEASRQALRTVGDTLVKVAREALVNAAKHAGPCRVSVTVDLPTPEQLRLRVSDNGAGGSARHKAESHGLTSLRRNVRRHGGSLRVTRGRSGGTTVTANLPV